MTYEISAPYDCISFDRSRSYRKIFSQSVSGAIAITLGVLAGASVLYASLNTVPRIDKAPKLALAVPPTRHIQHAAAPNTYVPLLDPTYSLGPEPSTFAQSAPLSTNFTPLSTAPTIAVAAMEKVRPSEAAPKLVESTVLPPLRPAELASQEAEEILLPPSRPHEFGSRTGHDPVHTAERQSAQENGTTVHAATPSDPRSIFEKLFGSPKPAGPVLAYAATEDGIVSDTRRDASRPLLLYGQETAVYDIAAHTVYMPDGTRLEAHSGLRDMLDDPRYVNERMRGATPPHVYDLELRPQPFHGVRALRLIPVGGGGIYGRTGLLAHSYMLGPNGQSNGCVSFRNYDAFLQAFLGGGVKRLAVVASLN
jgi:hypothetical protein